MIRKKVQNTLKITCTDVDLTKVNDIEFYVRQPNFFGCYVPKVVSAHEMIVVIPFADAMKLRGKEAKLQFAFVDADGLPGATDVVSIAVGNLLKEVGYNPISSDS